MFDVRIARRDVLVFGAALAALACVSFPEPRPFLVDSVAPPPAPIRPPRAPDVWRERGLVAARIASVERRALVFVEHDGRRKRITRSSTGVAIDAGRVQDLVVVGEPGGDGEFVFEGRRYRGALAVYAHPTEGLRVENWVALEHYVAGVVASEVVLWDAPPALLEAQAIAARSYAVATLAARAKSDRAFLWDGVEDQAYRGVFVPDNASQARGLDARLAKAVSVTRGRVLVHGRVPFDARFHASCGGHTAEGRLVFGPTAPLGPAVTCPGCSTDANWEKRFNSADLARAAEELGTSRFTRVVSTRNDAHGRWLEVELRGANGVFPVAAGELRRALGWGALPSTRVLEWVPLADGGAKVIGRGRGHGVGLCQDGARHFAELGFEAAAILAHYYPGSAIAPVTLPSGAER